MTQPSEPRTAPLHSPLGRIALNAIRWRSGQPNIACAMLEGDVRWLLRYLDEAEAAAPDPVASPGMVGALKDLVLQEGRHYRDGKVDEWLAVVPRSALRRAAAILALVEPKNRLWASLAIGSSEDPVASPADRSLIRAAISNAYYECREAGGSMETAADQAAAHVMDLLADPVASPAPLDADRLARALIESDLMPRYREYAMRVPTMDPSETVEHLAGVWAGWVAAAYALEGQPVAEEGT